MRFEERELKPYAKFVSVAALKVGGDYFSVSYVDDDMFIPFVETLVFVGRNLGDCDVGQAYLQDADSYLKGIRWDAISKEQERTVQCCREDKKGRINGVFEFDYALEELMRCALRRWKGLGAT